MNIFRATLFLGVWISTACQPLPTYDLVLKNGILYDGSGSGPYEGAIGINGDSIAYVGTAQDIRGKTVIDVAGKAIAPGFINMLSWAVESLIQDGRSQSDIRQGVTLEVFGEGMSYGPLSPEMKEEMQRPFCRRSEWQTGFMC